MDTAIQELATRIANPELACIFSNTLPNCLDTTILRYVPADGGDDEDTFVVTGDIPAMWIRDSMNQVLPYMRFAKQDPKLQSLLRGVLRRQTKQLQTDVFANAHCETPGHSPWTKDHTTMDPEVFERKYELDSLCAFFKLGAEYWKSTSDPSPFGSSWVKVVELVAATMRSMQSSTAEDQSGYSFQRCTSCEPTDTLFHGHGFPGNRVGLIRSMFRPSDDATQLPFLVPANAMAVVELRRTAALLLEPGVSNTSAGTDVLALELEKIASEVDAALRREAVVVHRRTGQAVYSFEVDGYGNSLHIDDGNVPSLLSLPYLGYTLNSDETYAATRKLVLNASTNPFYFEGTAGRGVGSPHTGLGRIWPMSIIMQAMTSDSDDEILSCLNILTSTTASRWLMHESFDQNNATQFSRLWFSWANSLFGELILRLAEQKPGLILKSTGIIA